MEKENKPVEENTPIAGEEQETETSEKSGETNTEEKNEVSAETLLKELEATDGALEAAQKKIVHLKKGGKEVDADADLREEVEDLREKLNSLTDEKADEGTSDLLKVIEEQRKRNLELRQTLISKQTTSNTALGSNQSKPKVEADVLDGYSAEDIRFLEVRAKRKGYSDVRSYLKSKKNK